MDLKTLLDRFKGRKLSFYAALAFCLVIIAGAIYFLSTPNKSSNNTTQTLSEESGRSNLQDSNGYQENSDGVVNNPAPSELYNQPDNILSSQKLTTIPTDSICGLEPGDLSFNTSFDRSSLTYKTVGGSDVPISSIYGGNKSDDEDLRTCYQFSTQGAALAAFNFAVGLQDTATQKDIYENHTVSMSEPPKVTNITSKSKMKLMGYHIDYQGVDAVVITLLFDYANKSVRWDIPVKWDNGDWKFYYMGSLASAPSETDDNIYEKDEFNYWTKVGGV